MQRLAVDQMDKQQMASPLPEPIAIIGAGCRFPGDASSPSKLWQLLEVCSDVQSQIDMSRFATDEFINQEGVYQRGTVTDKAYLLSEDIRLFDNNFFGIRAQEAEAMDPQQRQLLEVVFESLEAAGYSIQEMAGSDTAVFVGQLYSDFLDIVMRDAETAPEYTATGTSRSITSNRLSYFFDWRGPSMTIDTACSSSLVAVHQAIQSLRNGESTMAIAAGVNLILGPEQFIFESKMNMLSPTGRCRMWDADANGYARGEGFAAVVLKRLSQALDDGDDIESVIRETGVNQDGRSMGITMPSAEAQAEVIRSTYKRCGLNPLSPQGRCQYFEAHGTGTPAGDPIEARAIQSAFFPESESSEPSMSDSRLQDKSWLWVGSIKTIIGHTEGTAGLAGLLKASLMVQKGLIPANLHHERLNPAVEAFCQHLRVPTVPQDWPRLQEGVPRRVSVNSFGFGGTNCHAIVEGWTTNQRAKNGYQRQRARPYGPVVLSANSPSSLKGRIESLASLLASKQDLELADVVWTLQTRRSEFPYKASFIASSAVELGPQLQEWLRNWDSQKYSLLLGRSQRLTTSTIPLLGIFTGQGAQWPLMGAVLFERSVIFRETLRTLQRSLEELGSDKPSWSLETELMASPDKSRVNEAAISQPLCTAVQVALVDMLASAGLRFSRVVGHSSGEIAAAYAAGYLSASDAVRVAYYRGICSHHASGHGRMLAADMSLAQAQSFCDGPEFDGVHLVVAASNAPNSVTLSGDEEAVNKALEILTNDKGIFARILKVDVAYHSPHMQLCVPGYQRCLQQCQIQVLAGSDSCTWYSSVYLDTPADALALDRNYWIDNMTHPVLFSQALTAALTDHHSGHREATLKITALEVGPHPALKMPATRTADALGTTISHQGVLRRGSNDLDAFCEALGFVWCQFVHVGKGQVVDFENFRMACLGDMEEAGQVPTPQLCKDLSTYPWDHERPFWRESRLSHCYRTCSVSRHPLLGSRTSTSAHTLCWRNTMRLQDLPWLRGHQFQSQAIFPAQGYVSMAIDGCLATLRSEQSARDLELRDLVVHRALLLEEEAKTAVEILTTVRIMEWYNDKSMRLECTIESTSADYIAGEYKYQQDAMHKNFNCQATLRLASGDLDCRVSSVLPPRSNHEQLLSPIDVSRFYSQASINGLQYTGIFQCKDIKHANGLGVVSFRRPHQDQIQVHPAALDMASHGMLAALSWHSRARSSMAYLPTSIECVRVDLQRLMQRPLLSSSLQNGDDVLIADSYLRQVSSSHIACDVEVYSAFDNYPEIQMQGLRCSALNPTTSADDGPIFSLTAWRRDISHGIDSDHQNTELEIECTERLQHLHQAIYHFLCELRQAIPSVDDIPIPQGHSSFWHWAVQEALPRLESTENFKQNVTQLGDAHKMKLELRNSHAENVDLEVVMALGGNLISIVRGLKSSAQILEENGLLTRWYEAGEDNARVHRQVASAVAQIAHRYPSMRILELGAGSGAVTSAVLQRVDALFASYTITDIHAENLDEIRQRLDLLQQTCIADVTSKLQFCTLDISRDALAQGFKKSDVDLVIAADVLHTTPRLAETLRHCRRLLRPGGYILLAEKTSRNSVLTYFVRGTEPSWWLNATRDDERKGSPIVSEARWDTLLAQNGFSGADIVLGRRPHDPLDHYEGNMDGRHSVIVSQASDEYVDFLRDPLRAVSRSGLRNQLVQLSRIIIITTQEDWNLRLGHQVQAYLHQFTARIEVMSSIEFAPDPFPANTAVLCLAEMDKPLFRDMPQHRFLALQRVLCNATHVLWLSRGGFGDLRDSPETGEADPHAAMVLGIMRSLLLEFPGRPVQFIGTGLGAQPSGAWVSSAFLRLVTLSLSSSTSGRGQTEGVLWSAETEMAVNEDGETLWPRVIPDIERTSRLDSQLLRTNMSDTRISEGLDVLRLVTSQDQERFELLCSPEVVRLKTFPMAERLEVQVQFSTVCAFKSIDMATPVYICLGIVRDSGEWVVTLSPDNASLIVTNRTNIIKATGDEANKEDLGHIVREIVAEELLRDAGGQKVWIHGTDKTFAEAILRKSQNQQSSLFLTCETLELEAPLVKVLHPKLTVRVLESSVPQDVSVHANLNEGHDTSLGASIRKLLGSEVRMKRILNFKDGKMLLKLDICQSDLCSSIKSTLASKPWVKEKTTQTRSLIDYIPVSKITSRGSPKTEFGVFDVLDWTRTTNTRVSVRMAPLDASKLFSPDKTYFLAGLTGTVGQSLCNFMASHGARYFALASRNPVIHPSDKLQLERKGATVRIFAVDIADRAGLEAVRDSIRAPDSGLSSVVGGVVNGAMVLRDKAFANMAKEDFETVLRPKVQGTLNLEAVFGSSDGAPGLEFFVLMSSASSVLGVPGLSNYNAGNLFMTAHAKQRRRRGLSASVIDISVLSESGYLARGGMGSGSSTEAVALARRYHASLLNDASLYALFTEAIFSGRQNTGTSGASHIHLGIPQVYHDKLEHVPGWYRFPRLSHLVKQGKSDGKPHNRAQADTTEECLQDRLKAARDTQEIVPVLMAALAAKLGHTLQMAAGSLDTKVPLLALGVDSLVAIQLRSWLVKEVGTDISVLTILSCASTEELCSLVSAKLKGGETEAETNDGLTESATSSEEQYDLSGGVESSSPRSSSVNSSRRVKWQTQRTTFLMDQYASKQQSRAAQASEADDEYVRTGELSHGQNRIFYLHSMLDDKTTYNCAGGGSVRGPLDVMRLQKALNRLADRHEILRTCFVTDEASGKVVQRVKRKAYPAVIHKRIASDEDYKLELRHSISYKFDISRGETMRVIVLSQSSLVHSIIVVYHHIIMDGPGLTVFMQELGLVYSGQDPPASALHPVQVSQEQRDRCTPEIRQRELKYWADQFFKYADSSSQQHLAFSKMKHRNGLERFHSHTFELKLGAAFARKVLASCGQHAIRSQAVTPFHFYLAALAGFLSGWLGVNDLTVGIVDSNLQDDGPVIGYFLNLLALRFRSDDGLAGRQEVKGSNRRHDARFDELLVATRDKVMAALAHSTTPFEDVLSHLGVASSQNHRQLFQTALNYRVTGRSRTGDLWGEDCEVRWTDVVVARNPFDIYVDITSVGQEDVWLQVGLQSSLFQVADAEMLCRSFAHVLEALVEPTTGGDTMLVRNMHLADEAGKQKALQLGSGPILTLGTWEPTIVHRVMAAVHRYTFDVAIRDGTGAALTYGDLLNHVREVAETLRGLGVTRASVVALYVLPSAETLCAMLAIMWVGAVYVPLDRRSPLERLSLIVQDCEPEVIIHHGDDFAVSRKLAMRSQVSSALLDLSSPIQHLASMSTSHETMTGNMRLCLPVSCAAADLAAIIYTSGSTGRPKGVLLSHENLVNQVVSVHHLLDIGREVVLQQSSLGFDCSMEQIFTGLAHGGCVVVAPDEARGDPAALAHLIFTHQITYTVGVPSEYAALLRYGTGQLKGCLSWRIAVSGGEQLTEAHASLFRELDLPQLRLINAYGPAEGTISCSRGAVNYHASGDPSIGRVMPNYQVAIVNEDLAPLPIGCPGEICIGGMGVAQGYLERPDETLTHFFTSPKLMYDLGGQQGNARFYRTGDMGRFTLSGSLEYLGRIRGCSQVQVRGVRVELEEVAAVIVKVAGTDAVCEAAVSMRDGSLLVAFVVFRPEFALDRQEFLDRLLDQLPLSTSMRPSMMIPVDGLPITENGKRDQRAVDALPIPSQPRSAGAEDQDSAGTTFLTPLESQIQAAWEEVLPVNRPFLLDRGSNFFSVGGNSLMLLRLQSVLRTMFSVHIPLSHLFRCSSIELMAVRVKDAMDGLDSRGPPDWNMDWSQEIAALVDGLSSYQLQQDSAIHDKWQSRSSGITVILTGTTGFLGTHILSRLVSDPRVYKVHCVAIRPRGDDIRRPTMYGGNPKIVEYIGDLGAPRLGLSNDDFAQLSRSVDLIIHNGAAVSFLQPYTSLRRPNVLATRALIEMALPRAVPLHFVSSASVDSLDDGRSLAAAPNRASVATTVGSTLSIQRHPKKNTDGYTASKWASEMLLSRCVSENCSLRATIHRPTSLVGDGAPETDWVSNVVRLSRILGVAPKLEGLMLGTLNLIEVEVVADAIVQSSLKSVKDRGGLGDAQISTLHHCSDVDIMPSEFPAYLSRHFGVKLLECDAVGWLHRARQSGLNVLVGEFLESWWETNGRERIGSLDSRVPRK